MTEFEKRIVLIAVIQALLNFAVIVVAVWGEPIRQFFDRPKLRISLTEPALDETEPGIQGWFYFVQVTSDKPSSPAKNVRLLLTHVYKKGPDGSWQEEKFSGPLQAVWWDSQSSPQYKIIGPDELSAFGVLDEKSNFFELQLHSYKNNFKREILKNEPTRLEFKAVSDAAESKSLTIEVAWGGMWVEGSAEMRNHCIVKEIVNNK